MSISPPSVRVSVIVPAHNSTRTIMQALDSVEAQTFRDLELVVIDDASTDDTREQLDSRPPGAIPLRVVALPRNLGPAGARNRGVAESTAPWLAFLDADDVWAPRRIERQMAVAAAAPDVGLICGGTVELGAHDEAVGWPPDDRPAPPRRFGIEDFLAGNPVATSTVLMRRELFESAGGFDPSFRGPEDYDLWMRAVRKGAALLMHEPLAGYRRVAGSLSMDDRRFLPEVLRVLDKAFAPDGALHGVGSRRRARSYQFACAAWSAAQAGRHARAWQWFARALLECPWPIRLRNQYGWRLKLAWNLVKTLFASPPPSR